jgi:hypothetical protein
MFPRNIPRYDDLPGMCYGLSDQDPLRQEKSSAGCARYSEPQGAYAGRFRITSNHEPVGTKPRIMVFRPSTLMTSPACFTSTPLYPVRRASATGTHDH